MLPVGTTALVTGASRGIGRAIALRLAAEGADIAVAARSGEELDSLRQEVRRLGRRCFSVECDLRRVDSPGELARRVLAEFGRLDILVNNAGVAAWAPIGEIRAEQLEEMWAVNVRAVFLLTQALVPSMVARGSGTIVNIGSTSGRRAYPEGTAYCASKFAVSGFSEALAKELQPAGVRVCTIFPGSVNTYLGGSAPSEWEAEMLDPEDIAASVLHVATMPSRVFVTELVVWPRGEEIS